MHVHVPMYSTLEMCTLQVYNIIGHYEVTRPLEEPLSAQYLGTAGFARGDGGS